jgi:hypothetical protein
MVVAMEKRANVTHIINEMLNDPETPLCIKKALNREKPDAGALGMSLVALYMRKKGYGAKAIDSVIRYLQVKKYFVACFFTEDPLLNFIKEKNVRINCNTARYIGLCPNPTACPYSQ